MTRELIETPYGRKTPELLTAAMDAHTLQPELLSALVRMLVGATGESLPNCEHYDGILCDAIDEAREVIAKAEGRA